MLGAVLIPLPLICFTWLYDFHHDHDYHHDHYLYDSEARHHHHMEPIWIQSLSIQYSALICFQEPILKEPILKELILKGEQIFSDPPLSHHRWPPQAISHKKLFILLHTEWNCCGFWQVRVIKLMKNYWHFLASQDALEVMSVTYLLTE